jgi:hypothetical protein
LRFIPDFSSGNGWRFPHLVNQPIFRVVDGYAAPSTFAAFWAAAVER